jgi:hypothetical protein
MVNPYSGISCVSVPKIIPERIDRFVWVELSDGVGPALREQLLVGGPRLREKQGIIDPALGLVGVEFRADDVVIAGQNRWLIERNKILRIVGQAVESARFMA